MEKSYWYKYYTLEAKREYHKRMEEIITMNLDNENDRDALLNIAHEHIAMARHHAHHAQYSEDDYKAMEHDYLYAEHMARAMLYLTRSRNLRIKEKTDYGNQF